MDQCVAGGAAEAVEQCVLRMHIMSLDLNQVRLGPRNILVLAYLMCFAWT